MVPRPASWAGVSDPGSSTRASGLPPVCRISRSRTSSATGTPARSLSIAAAAAASMPPTTSSGNSSLSKRRTSPSRAANSSATRSGPSLRATKSIAAVEASSNQCASSTTHRTGNSSAASASRLRVARKTRNRSPAVVSVSPNAARSAVACRAGRCSTCLITGRSNRCSAAKGNGDSDSMPWVRRIRMSGSPSDPARFTRSVSSADFPTPGCPRTTGEPPREPRAASRRAASRSCSRSRPCSTPAA